MPIRRESFRDAPVVEAYLVGLNKAFRERSGFLLPYREERRDEFVSLFHSDEDFILAMHGPGGMEGGCLCLRRRVDGQDCLRIARLWVAAGARRRGIATSLLQEAENMGRTRGIRLLHLSVVANYAPAVRCYVRFGFRRRAVYACSPGTFYSLDLIKEVGGDRGGHPLSLLYWRYLVSRLKFACLFRKDSTPRWLHRLLYGTMADSAEGNTALVIGSGRVNAAGLIRSLGTAGFRVVYASCQPKLESRWCSGYLRLPEDAPRRLAALSDFLRSLPGKPAVFPSDDDTACWLDQNHAELESLCHPPHAKGLWRQWSDKARQNELARQVGLNVLPFRILELEGEIPWDAGYPVILKPLSGILGRKGDIRICHREEDFQRAIVELKSRNYTRILAQRFLEAPGQYEIGVMGMALPDGTVELPGVIRKIRSYPPGRGSTSYARVVPDFGTLDGSRLAELVRKTGYVGLFDVELIHCGDVDYFIEINLRNGQYGYATTAFGWNLPARWAHFMQRGELPPEPACGEITYMNEREDFQHVKEGRLPFLQWWRQFRKAKAHGLFCPGDQRPFIRQFVKIPDRLLMWIDRRRKRIHDLLFREEWVLAYRRKGDSLLFEKKGGDRPFQVARDTWRYWFADPFLLEWKGDDYAFCEMYDRIRGKGMIGWALLRDDAEIHFRIACEAPWHLSFPLVFSDRGKVYMLPESSYGRRLRLYRALSFPDRWEPAGEWLAGEKPVDSVIFQSGERTCLLSQTRGEDELLGFLFRDGQWLPFECNPVAAGKEKARMGGAVIARAGQLFRTAQDCSEAYGKSLRFLQIDECSPDSYREHEVARVGVEDITVGDGRRYEGMHTYNVGGNHEIIDLKLPARLRMGNLLNLALRLIMRFPGKTRSQP